MFAASKTASVSGGYQIQRSLRFNSADSAYLNRTPASASNQKTWTWSGWVKRGKLDVTQYTLFNATGGQGIRVNDDAPGNQIRVRVASLSLIFTPVLRDPSAWYHIVVSVDTTQATSSDRVKLYINNQLASLSSGTYPSQNADTGVNAAVAHFVGAEPTPSQYYDGLMTEINFIDGQALTPSSFGETNAQTGVWQPKAYSGSYGTNGFYLNFSDNSNTTAATLGKDYSGNGNNWTPNNFSVTAGAGNDSLVDSPTSYGTDTGVGGTVRGNYCTFSPIQNYGLTLANGNLDVSVPSSSSSYNQVAGTIGVSAGKWYFEYYMSQLTINGNVMVGVMNQNNNVGASTPYNTVNTWMLDNNANGKIYARHSGTTTDLGSRPASAFTGMVAIDLDAGKIWFGANGTWLGSGDPATGVNPQFSNLSGVLQPIAHGYTVNDTGIANFGQRPFAYTAPSGYKALCTQNLPTPTIGATTATQANKYFNPVLYNGNGGTLSVTGVGFQPDLVWLKVRNYAFVNGLFDAVRGGGKLLISNLTLAELTNDPNGYVSSFNSDGFTLTPGSTNNDTFNGSLNQMVSWNWKANGSGSTNTAGSITSTVSANTTSGFSVVNWTQPASGTYTIGHGLGVAPAMILMKSRTNTGNWAVYHQSLSYTQYGRLNTTDAFVADSSVWVAAPTSSVFSQIVNYGTGGTSIAYCFAEVAGYSKFGSYTGNGSSDGVFVFTGFKPAYIMVKCSSGGGTDWIVEDATRSTTNVMDARLFPNTSDAEISNGNGNIDFLSNGFKLRNAHAGMNASGSTYIYACFASVPTKFSLAR